MDFLKKHYEKVLLGVVLLGLAVAVAFLPFKIASERQKLEDARNNLTHPKVQPLTNLDLTMAEGALKRAAAPMTVDFSTSNKLFNPVQWQQAVDKHLIKVDDSSIGPKAVVITKIAPLYLTLMLDSVMTSETGTKYVITIENEAAGTVEKRKKHQTVCSLNVKADTVTLRNVQGKAEEPDSLTLEFNDSGDKAVVKKELPFKRVDGHTADLKYAPENKTWTNRRTNSVPLLSFNGEKYNIVAINDSEVVLSAESNKKKSIIKYVAAP